MMQLLLFGVYALFLELGNYVASQDLFSDYDDLNENLVGFEPLALEDSGSIAQQVGMPDYDPNFTPNANFWYLSDDSTNLFETSGDGLESTDLIAGSCPSSNILRARNAADSCLNPNKEDMAPIPTLEEMLGAVGALHETLEDKVCFPPRLFHLCCICGGFTNFNLCDDCEPCKLSVHHMSTAAEPKLFSSGLSKCLSVWDIFLIGTSTKM